MSEDWPRPIDLGPGLKRAKEAGIKLNRSEERILARYEAMTPKERVKARVKALEMDRAKLGEDPTTEFFLSPEEEAELQARIDKMKQERVRRAEAAPKGQTSKVIRMSPGPFPGMGRKKPKN